MTQPLVEMASDERAATGHERGSKSYRYPGSPPFRDVALDRRLFKGRVEESRTVLHSILSSDLFLLYAVSGMGKSSLLNAGVMHELRQRGHWPVSVRLNDPRVSPAATIEQQIADAAQADDEIDLVRTPGLDVDGQRDASLWEVLGSIEVWRGSRLERLVIVLDQFEELFTLDWPHDVRTRFISEFGEVMRHSRSPVDSSARTPTVPPPDVKFVLVVREDALGELEALADDVPQLMQARFRLGPLEPDQALVAIREPASVTDDALETQQFAYTDEASREILEFLQHAERDKASMISEPNRSGVSVDPSQLQIICQYIERRVLPNKRPESDSGRIAIEASDLGGADGLRNVLGDFYRRTVASFPESDHRRVRELCERGLISPSQRRLSLESGAIDDAFDVPLDILDRLVDLRLLRAEPRVGSVYYELAHDTLVQPILRDRLQRQQERSQQRRRRVVTLVSLVVASIAVAMSVLAALTLFNEGDGDGESPATSVDPPPTTSTPPALLLGPTPVGETIDTAGAVVEFRLFASAEPIQIIVDPADGLNVAVDITSTSGARRAQDQLGRGLNETIIVPAGSRDDELLVTVTSNDESTGSFTISTNEIVANPLETSGSQSGSIPEPGSSVVFVADAASSIALDVRPRAPSAGQSGSRNKGLDVEILLIDASGRGQRVDIRGPGEPETTTLDDIDGQTLIVVRGYQTSIGDFDITMREVDRDVLIIDTPLLDQSADTGQPVEYAIQVPQGGLATVVTPQGDFDPLLELIDPDGQPVFIDSGGPGGVEAANLSAVGEHVLRVSSFDGTPGDFDIVATAPTALDPDSAAQSSSTPATFLVASDVVAGLGELWVLDAEPDDPDQSLQVLISDQTGSRGGAGQSASAGDRVTIAVNGGAERAGSRLILVTSTGEERGVTMNLTSVVVMPLVVGSEVSTTPAPTAFDVDVDADADELLVFTATPTSADEMLTVQVNDPGGYTTDITRSSDVGKAVSVVVGGLDGFPGERRIVVTSSGEGGVVETTLESITSTQLEPGGESVSATAPIAFEVDLEAGELLVFTATPDRADDALTLQVNAPGGFRTDGATSPSNGESVAVVVGGPNGGQGPWRVVVTSPDAGTTLKAMVNIAESIPLVPDGTPAITPAPAVFDFGLEVDQLAVATVRSASASDLLSVAVLTSQGDFAAPTAQSPSPGVPVAILLDERNVSAGSKQLVVSTTETGVAVTSTLDTVSARLLEVGDPVTTSSAPAVFDVVVGDGDGEALTFTAETDAPDSLLSVQVFDLDGFPTGRSSVFQPLPSLSELPLEIVELFSPAVRELFAQGLPPTVEEAVAQLSDAGLLQEVITVLNENDIAADTLLDADVPAGPARVSVDVGGGLAGQFRVVVSSVDRDADIRVELTAST